MNIIDAISSRRSIRKYTNEPLTEYQLEAILKAGFQAPSAHNINPRDYVVIRDREVLESITDFHPYTKMLPSAGCGIVVCGDSKLQEKRGFLVTDCSASIENMLLAAHGLGLGGVWCGLYPIPELMGPISDLLKLPEGIIPIGLVVVGVPDEKKEQIDKYDETKIHHNTW